jgi:hypothetical protein
VRVRFDATYATLKRYSICSVYRDLRVKIGFASSSVVDKLLFAARPLYFAQSIAKRRRSSLNIQIKRYFHYSDSKLRARSIPPISRIIRRHLSIQPISSQFVNQRISESRHSTRRKGPQNRENRGAFTVSMGALEAGRVRVIALEVNAWGDGTTVHC